MGQQRMRWLDSITDTVDIAQSCPTLFDPMTSPPGSSVRWSFLGKNTGVVAISFSGGSSQPRD